MHACLAAPVAGTSRECVWSSPATPDQENMHRNVCPLSCAPTVGVWQTPRGEVRVSWSYSCRGSCEGHEGARASSSAFVSLNATFPPNTEAKVVFPCLVGQGAITESGVAVWSGGRFQEGAAGVVGGGVGPSGNAELECSGGGAFHFRGPCV